MTRCSNAAEYAAENLKEEGQFLERTYFALFKTVHPYFGNGKIPLFQADSSYGSNLNRPPGHVFRS